MRVGRRAISLSFVLLATTPTWAAEAILWVPPLASFADAILGGGSAVPAVPAGYAPELYEPRPGDLERLRGARRFLALGTPEEQRLWRRLRSQLPALAWTPLQPREPRSAAERHPWLSPRRLRQLASRIAAAMGTTVPAHLDAQLLRLDHEVARLLAPVRGRTVWCYHPAWNALLRDYGLRSLLVEREGKEPSPRELAATLAEVRRRRIGHLVVPVQIDPRPAEVLARRVGATILRLDPLDPNWERAIRRAAEVFAEIAR